MLNGIRAEGNLSGTRGVPTDTYYGAHTLRAIEDFYISDSKISDIPESIRDMVMVKKATALANKELQTIPESAADAIIAACNEALNNDKYMDQFPVDVFQGEAGTFVNMNTSGVLVNIGLESMGHQKGEYQCLNPNDHVSKCQSINDVYSIGSRITVYASTLKLIGAIKQLDEGFQAKAAESQDIFRMGRTQLQNVVSMTLDQGFHAFNVLLNEETKSILRTAELLLEVNLGIITVGTRLNTPDGYQQLAAQKLAGVSNLPAVPAEDLIETTSDCGTYIMVHGSPKCLAVKLPKICNDLRPLSSGPRADLNGINLPRLQAGPSTMPARVNPVIPEVVNQVCFKVTGNDITVTMASEAGQPQLSMMEPVIGQVMFKSIRTLTNAYHNLLKKCVNGIAANKAVCGGYVYNSIGIITYLNPFTSRHNGDIVDKICAEIGKSTWEVVLERGLLTAAELGDIFSTQNLMRFAYKAGRYIDESEQ